MFEPLNLEMILVNYLAGSWNIFFYIALIGIVFLAAKFRMPSFAIVLMVTLFITIFAIQFSALYSLVILIVGIFLAIIFARAIKQ